jgi:hypothetical protein
MATIGSGAATGSMTTGAGSGRTATRGGRDAGSRPQIGRGSENDRTWAPAS